MGQNELAMNNITIKLIYANNKSKWITKWTKMKLTKVYNKNKYIQSLVLLYNLELITNDSINWTTEIRKRKTWP